MKRAIILLAAITTLYILLLNTVSAATPLIVSNTQKRASDYQLAYPGLLPDNPLYVLKVLRDKIIAFLITDPQKKTDYFLLQADKLIASVPELVDKKEIDLAKTTALKGENNMTELTFVYKNYGTKPDASMYETLMKASLKHQEVLSIVMKKVSSQDAKTFLQVINFSKTNQQEITNIYHSL